MTTKPRDLTAERAATDMYNRLFSVMRLPEHEQHAKARLKLFYQVTRQEALREAAKQLKLGARLAQTRGVADALSGHAYMLDRLASEGG